jgi:hypothetical protein
LWIRFLSFYPFFSHHIDELFLIERYWMTAPVPQDDPCSHPGCKSFYSMGGILMIKWAAKRAIECRNVFAHCQKMALSALLAVPGFLRTHPHNCQDSSESAHLIPKFTARRALIITALLPTIPHARDGYSHASRANPQCRLTFAMTSSLSS